METLKFLEDLKELNGRDLNVSQRSMVSRYIMFLEKKLRVI